jgi:steroid delta-isomerase-like uncharacterized protein
MAISMTTTMGSARDQAGLEAMKGVVLQWVDVLNSGTLDGIGSVWAEDCVVHAGGGLPEVRGVEGLGGLLTTYRAALSHLHITTESLVAEGDKVAARFTTRGRHDGEFLDIPATGAPIEIGGFGLFRIAGGRIAEEWLLDDLASFITQVRIVSALAQTGGAS